jgi:nucleoid-associated protein YgaU
VDKSRDRGLIYLLVTILVVILIVAVGVIVFMGMKMMDMQKEQESQKGHIQTSKNLQSVDVQAEIKRAVQEQIKKIKPSENRAKEQKLAREDIATIVQMVMSQMQNSKPKEKLPKGSSQKQGLASLDSELREIVDAESSNTQKSPENSGNKTGGDSDLESVLDVLRSVDVDSVDEVDGEDISLDSLDLDNIEAKDKVDKKKKDTFNKVIIESNGSGGELSKLGSEIDKLVEKSAKDLKESAYEKQMKKEIRERRNAMRIIVVRRGDTLSKIAKRAYGSGKERYYKKILRANPRLIKNPDRIFVGQRLRVPR